MVRQDGNLRASEKYLLEPVVMEYTDGTSREYARRLVLTFDIDDIPMPTPPWINAVVIPPFLAGRIRRIHAAIFSFWAGVMPPMPMFGRSLL